MALEQRKQFSPRFVATRNWELEIPAVVFEIVRPVSKVATLHGHSLTQHFANMLENLFCGAVAPPALDIGERTALYNARVEIHAGTAEN